MKKYILSLCAALLLPLPAFAGDVAPGSVPGTLNYQGRLERDNAPITGPVHLYFRIYNSPTANNASGGECGGIAQPCLWESPEITAQATQGIFSADLTPPAAVLSGGERLYLEVQVESDTLSPREPLNSVAYAVVAKRLEDGASVQVTTLTANFNVLLATATGAQVGIGGVISPSRKLTVDGDIEIINGGALRFLTSNSAMTSANIGTVAGGITSPSANATIEAGTGYNILFGIPNTTITGEKARITSAGDFGIGTLAPNGKLDVNGSLFVGNEGIFDRVDAEVNIKEDLVVEGGQVRGIGNNYIALGDPVNAIVAATNNLERLRIDASGNLGVGGTAPASERVYSAANIRAAAGVRGANVSIGAYSNTWTGLANEVRAADASHLLLQQTNSFNVGIGTDTPREKLHVRGSVLADYGVMATTAAFSGNVRVDGDLDANSSNGNMVYLSSTVVYGSLQVTGGIGSMAGLPAYIASSNTFTGQNTFSNQTTVSSDVIVNSRLGVGAIGFDFPGDDYLQVGGNTSEFAHNASAYLVAGSTGEARVAFYRGPVKAASLETLSGNYLPNLALVVGGQAKTITDSVYHRIQNSVVWISTGYQGTPSIYVSSSLGNVGIGTSIMEPAWKLTVDGNIRISKDGGGLLFPDGTSITTGNLGALSVGNLSNNSDAVVQSNADLVGGGNVILRAGSLDGLVLNTGGNVGIGTINPVSRLNVRGGDLVLGTPLNPYSADSVEDLVVAGNIAFDGELLQRSNLQVRLSGLMVASDVYLSTGAAARTGIGTITPQTKLEVNGDAQFGSGLTKSTFTSAGALLLASDLAVQYGGTGAGTFTDGGVLFGNGTAALGVTDVLTNGQLLIGDGTQEPTLATLTQTANQVLVTNGAGSITLSLPQDIHTAADPTFDLLTLTTPLAVASGGTGLATLPANRVLYGADAGDIASLPALTNGQLIIGNTGNAPSVAALGGTSNQIIVTNGAGTITLSLPQNIHTGGNPTFSAITTSSSGTFKAVGATQYSVETASGILVNDGVLNMTTGRIINLGDPLTSSDAATRAYVDNASGGGYGAWGLRGNNVGASDFIGTTGLGDDMIFMTTNVLDNPAERMRITSGGTIKINGFGLGAVISDASGNLSTGNYAGSASAGGAANDVACTNCVSLGTETNGTYDTTADTIADDGLITLTSEVDGILPATNGGTNNAFTQFSGPATAAKTFTLPNANATILTDNADVTVAQGGTGVGSLTSNAVLLGGASVGSVGPGAANTVLRGTGASAPTFGTINSNYTTGESTSFEVYSSTGAAGTCRTLTITNGMVTGISGTPHACPAP
ncbi:MAG: beta strand repeat-containing protein [Elusimicrobiales bacterium]